MMRQLTRLLMLSCLLISPSLRAAGYRYEKIDVPGAAETIAYGVNARGEIVGAYWDADGTSHNFLLRNGVFKTIKFPGAAAMFAARGINARGDIIGNFLDSKGRETGYLLSDGKFQRIQHPEFPVTLVTSINNAGDIVGLYGDDNSAYTFIRTRNGKFHVIDPPWKGGINVRSAQDNGRVLVGSADTADTDGFWHGFVRTKPGEFEVIDYPGLPVPCSMSRYINERGDIVGVFHSVNSGVDCLADIVGRRGYLLRDGRFKAIHFPGAAGTDAFAINDDGMIVGFVVDKDGSIHGFRAVPK